MAEPSRFCLVLERASEDVHEPEFVADLPLVSFDAFVAGHRVFGWIRLDADRLTDLLNDHEELLLVNVMVEHLADGSTVTADEAVVRRADLVAVRASGPRGEASRREDTQPHPVIVESGPYRIGGHVHAAPGIGPARRIRGGKPMIPLTEAWIEYRSGDELQRRRLGTIIVNRDLAARIDPVAELDVEPGGLAAPGVSRG
jgi:hypothetical protein